ncbi:hypothetical protein [Streptomyces sp. NPDC092952]|uniref:hypothetical protein n=1 Tax=Streptomyces sp. NPDC092952 TaxID=3366018 RepID=UPI00380A8E12
MANPSDDLIKLARASAEVKAKALSGPYSGEAWGTWRTAAEEFLAAVATEAAATGQSRYALEMAAKAAARPGSPADGA